MRSLIHELFLNKILSSHYKVDIRTSQDIHHTNYFKINILIAFPNEIWRTIMYKHR